MPSSRQDKTECEALLTPDEVCTVLKISTAKFYRLVTSGRLPAVKIGSNWRVRPSTLGSWINNQSASAKSNST